MRKEEVTTMRIHLHPWTSLKQSFPIRKSEWVMACVTVGLWLLFSIHTDLFNAKEYGGMAAMAPQFVWAWMLFVVGVGRLAALTVNGMHWRSPHFRAGLAFLNCFVWYQLSVGLAQNVGVGMVVFPGLLALDVFNFRQAFLEAAASEGLKDGERKRLRAHS